MDIRAPESSSGSPSVNRLICTNRSRALGDLDEVADRDPRVRVDGPVDRFQEGHGALALGVRAQLAVAVGIERPAVVTAKHVPQIAERDLDHAEAVSPHAVHQRVHLGGDKPLVEDALGGLYLPSAPLSTHRSGTRAERQEKVPVTDGLRDRDRVKCECAPFARYGITSRKTQASPNGRRGDSGALPSGPSRGSDPTRPRETRQGREPGRVGRYGYR